MNRFFLVLLFPQLLMAQSGPEGWRYISPAPNSRFVTPQTNIILRWGEKLEPSSLNQEFISVSGSISGNHSGTLRLADDGKTVLFKPTGPFVHGEGVNVQLREGFRSRAGKAVHPLSFTFTVRIEEKRPGTTGFQPGGTGERPDRVNERPSRIRELHEGISELPAGTTGWSGRTGLRPGRTGLLPGTFSATSPSGSVSPSGSPFSLDRSSGGTATRGLPDNFPPFTFHTLGEQTGDPIFLSSFSWGADTSAPYLMILDRRGLPDFYRKVGEGWDFKVQPTGILTYYDLSQGMFFGLDSSYHIVDEFMCGNGYNTDVHELRVLPDGHAYLLSYDYEVVAMDTIVEGGNPGALVIGLIIQEIDREKNVVFQWRSWDHFQITDATAVDLTAAEIDYVHGNSIEIDGDGNLILSSRNMDEITKINRETGEIIWRWGGKNNQFKFVNDPLRFENQHNVRRLPNGNILMFDNGAYRGFSRAAEYTLNELDSTATLVWEHRATPDIFGWALGSAQRLPGGNTLIGWGSANPTATEVRPDGSNAFQIDLPLDVFSYRVVSSPWKTNAFVPATDTVTFPPLATGDSASFDLTVNNPTTYEITLTSVGTGTPWFTAALPETTLLPPNNNLRIHLTVRPTSIGEVSDFLEIRSEDSTSGIIRRVVLRGSSPAPTIAATPPFLDFGDVPLNGSRQLRVKLHNTSVNALSVDSAYTATSAFSVDRSRLTVQTVDSLEVTYRADAAGTAIDTLYLRNNSANSLFKVPLNASTPSAGLSVSVTQLNFGTVQTGDSSSRSFLVRNSSPSPLTINTAATGSGTFAPGFSLPINLSGGDSIKLSVQFKPAAAGTHRDTLRLASNNGSANITLQGIATPSVGVEQESDAIPATYSLAQNYPNPFNPSTVIAFGLPESGTVTLKIYDILGREVAVLVNDQLPAGRYRTRWVATGAASGVYLCRITVFSSAGGERPAYDQVKRLVLMK